MSNQKGFSKVAVIIIVLIGGILTWQFGIQPFTHKEIVPDISERYPRDVIIEESGGNLTYKGIVYSEQFSVNDSGISFHLDSNYDDCSSYEVKGGVDNLFLDEGNNLRKLSLVELDELKKKEEVLSVTVKVKKKETAFMRKLINVFEPVALANCYSSLGKIDNPEKIIFKKPGKLKLTITGKATGSASSKFWTFKTGKDQGLRQGLHIQNCVKTYALDDSEECKIETTYPSSYFLKFKNNPNYFKIPVEKFIGNLFLIEKITMNGEENCPAFDFTCIIKAETVKVETSLSLQDDKISKQVTASGKMKDVFHPISSNENYYFELEDPVFDFEVGNDPINWINFMHIADYTKFINGKIQDIKDGRFVKVEGMIKCPNFSEVLSDKNDTGFDYSCDFFVDELTF